MSARYRLSLCIEFSAGDDPAARGVVTHNMDALGEVASSLRTCTRRIPLTGEQRDRNDLDMVKVKLQRLNDDAPPRALVVETL